MRFQWRVARAAYRRCFESKWPERAQRFESFTLRHYKGVNMFKTVCFLSQASFENHLKPRKNTVAVSITDPGDKPAIINQEIDHALRVEFTDISEESAGLTVGDLPDLAKDGGPLLFLGCTFPDAGHAKKILDFLLPFAVSPTEFHLAVHCHAGVSRSAAVAAFVADRFCAEFDQVNPDTSFANERLLRMFRKVLDKEVLIAGVVNPALKPKPAEFFNFNSPSACRIF
jgi:predicted protein tyrosine phosphatase